MAVGCSGYTPLPGKKRCSHYQDKGDCSVSDAKCKEWLKLNTRKQPAGSATDLFGHPLPELKRPRRRQTEEKPAAQSPAKVMDKSVVTSAAEAEENAQAESRGLTTEDIDSFKALGVEVNLKSDTLGTVWLVPEYTDQDRKEITPEHAATLSQVMAVFQGSTIESFEKPTKETKV